MGGRRLLSRWTASSISCWMATTPGTIWCSARTCSSVTPLSWHTLSTKRPTNFTTPAPTASQASSSPKPLSPSALSVSAMLLVTMLLEFERPSTLMSGEALRLASRGTRRAAIRLAKWIAWLYTVDSSRLASSSSSSLDSEPFCWMRICSAAISRALGSGALERIAGRRLHRSKLALGASILDQLLVESLLSRGLSGGVFCFPGALFGC
uniref:Uncharacterized protein n=1 Tax=Ixodes ricinus TaxID=34613 RepID=A0A6B0V2Z9_IXORI